MIGRGDKLSKTSKTKCLAYLRDWKNIPSNRTRGGKVENEAEGVG